MEESLWYLLAGTRGSENRARIVRALDEQPRNANRLAGALGLDYNTVRHHLETLREHELVERDDEGYGTPYRLTDRFEAHRYTYRRIAETVGRSTDAPADHGEAGQEVE